MNHLAHCWLARGCDGHVAGGFLGDFYKGPIPSHLPKDFQEGLQLHRHIDTLTNQMDEMKSTYCRFSPKLRRVAPILLDMMADHILARFWDQHAQGKLPKFTAYCYETIPRYPIPERGLKAFNFIVSRNLWNQYVEFETILETMDRLLKRLKMSQLSSELKGIDDRLEEFHQDFCEYFPMIEQRATLWIENNTQSKAPKESKI